MVKSSFKKHDESDEQIETKTKPTKSEKSISDFKNISEVMASVAGGQSVKVTNGVTLTHTKGKTLAFAYDKDDNEYGRSWISKHIPPSK